MTLNPLLFLGLIELLLLLMGTAVFLFLRARRFRLDKAALLQASRQTQAWLDGKIEILNSAREENDTITEYRLACLNALAAPWRQETIPCSMPIWQASLLNVDAAIEALGGELEEANETLMELKEKVKSIPAVTASPGVEAAPEEGMENANEKLELEQLFAEQDKGLSAMDDYQEALTLLKQKSERMHSTNRKLVDYLKTLSSQDDKIQVFEQMLGNLEENNQELQMMMTQLEREKNRLEPQVAALRTQTRHLQALANSYHQRADKFLKQNGELQEKVNDLGKKIELRNKSLEKQHRKYEALRREYMALYEMSNRKGPSSRGKKIALDEFNRF